jgi:hypothetical protein
MQSSWSGAYVRALGDRAHSGLDARCGQNGSSCRSSANAVPPTRAPVRSPHRRGRGSPSGRANGHRVSLGRFTGSDGVVDGGVELFGWGEGEGHRTSPTVRVGQVSVRSRPASWPDLPPALVGVRPSPHSRPSAVLGVRWRGRRRRSAGRRARPVVIQGSVVSAEHVARDDG